MYVHFGVVDIIFSPVYKMLCSRMLKDIFRSEDIAPKAEITP